MKSKITLFGKSWNFGKWYKRLTIIDKRLLWGFLGLIIVMLFINLSIETFRNLNSDLSINDCNQLRIDDVRYYLQLQEENNWLAFLYAFQYPFKILLIAVAIGWVLHGVGFKVIGR